VLTFVSENKLRSKALNSIKLPNGEEIITENFEEINSKVIRAELNVITLRNLIAQYQTLYRTFSGPEVEEDRTFREIIDDDLSVKRYRAALLSNIRGVLAILDQNEIKPEILEAIRMNINDFEDRLTFDPSIVVDKLKMLEIQSFAENIISEPYRDWMYKEKTKIRCNFAEDAKRTWNRIKQPVGHQTNISPEIFADHYSQNWEVEPARININECSAFIM
jgi:hypothetical protein